jgi:hypothetical protein
MLCLYGILMLVARAPVEKAMPIQATIETFANDPVVVGGQLERGARGLLARLKARFANEELFRTGVRAILRARGDEAGTVSTQLLYLQQLVNPKGVPDIFQPVTRELVVELPAAKGLTNLVVLNTDAGFADKDMPGPSHQFAVGEAQPRPDGPADLVVRAEPQKRGQQLVALSRLRLHVEPHERTLRYTVSFQVWARRGALPSGAVQVTVRKQVLRDKPPLQGDWLFVTAPAKAVAVPTEASAVEVHRFEVTLEARSGPERLVIVGNYVSDPDIARQGAFAVLRVK